MIGEAIITEIRDRVAIHAVSHFAFFELHNSHTAEKSLPEPQRNHETFIFLSAIRGSHCGQRGTCTLFVSVTDNVRSW